MGFLGVIKTAGSDLWTGLTRGQKAWAVLFTFLIVAMIASGWVSSFQAWGENRQYEKQAQIFENQAIQAEREKQDALTLAAETGTKIKIAEEQLSKVEVKRNETRDEIKAGGVVVSRSRAEYERAVHERLPNVPSTDALCKQLADAGHPCYPN